MQMAVELPGKLVRRFKERFKAVQQKKILTEAMKRELEEYENDPIWKLPEIAMKMRNDDIGENHDKYLAEDLIKRKANL